MNLRNKARQDEAQLRLDAAERAIEAVTVALAAVQPAMREGAALPWPRGR
jgi:hypothetical protein